MRVRGRARARKLEEVESLVCPAARVPARALTTDRTGLVFERGIRGARSRLQRHGAQSDYDPRAVEIERFARKIARSLERARRAELPRRAARRDRARAPQIDPGRGFARLEPRRRREAGDDQRRLTLRGVAYGIGF